jgi:hypothetical protein
MTDPTAPVTPRTEAGRPCPHGFTSDCENCWFLRTHEHRFDLFAPDDAVCHADECTVTRGRAIEQEAAAPDAGSAALDVERLAEALNATVGKHGWARSTPPSPVEEWLVNAETMTRLAYEKGRADGREAGNTDALRAALLLLHEWREASLNDDAGALGTLTDATTDFIDGAALAASDAGPAGIDVETLTAALVDAEDDDQMGPEYRPERLAEYLHDWLDRLSHESDR